MKVKQPIGIFDSGYGGLTVFKSIEALLPDYDYVYFGDNARAPYGNRSFETVYQYTLESVRWFFKMGCPLVILACNTASAKALRNIQQQDLPKIAPENRVLGVIRPTAEIIGTFTSTGHIGILGTPGTINSRSYELEIRKFFPELTVHSLACPLWVSLIESGLYESEGADFFVQQNIDELFAKNEKIDTILLGCTHYPLMLEKIQKHIPPNVKLVAQGDIVAHSLFDYLQRNPEMNNRLSKNKNIQLFTTDSAEEFTDKSLKFFGKQITANHVHL